jgi:hypothetical protein
MSTETHHTSLDGIWTGEIFGPYGWEGSGTYMLENGRIVGGNDRHYSTGKFEISDDSYKAQVVVHYYGPPRAIFGEKREQFKIEVKGKVIGDVIDSEVFRPDKPEFSVRYRMTRRMDLPSIKI